MENQEQIIDTVLKQLGSTIGQLNIDLAISRTETAKLAQDLEILKHENEILNQELKKIKKEFNKEVIENE